VNLKKTTFELGGNIGKQIKNRSETNGCTSWLREMDLFRYAPLAADFCRWQTGAFQSPNPCTEPPLFGDSNLTQHTYLTKNIHKGCFLLNHGCA